MNSSRKQCRRDFFFFFFDGKRFGVEKKRYIYIETERDTRMAKNENVAPILCAGGDIYMGNFLLLNEKLETLLSECNISTDSFGGNISSWLCEKKFNQILR